MEYILLTIIGLFIVYAIIKSIVNNIRERIENKAIDKSKTKIEIEQLSVLLNKEFHPKIQSTKNDISQLKEQVLNSLPGLADRIDRDQRRQDYIKFNLPNKRYNYYKGYRRR